jgi:hypothetical protein
MPLHICIFATHSLRKMKEGENTFEAWLCPWRFKNFLSKIISMELIATALSTELLQPVTQETICTCCQVLQGGKRAEEFSHFSLLAPQKSWLFLEYVHVSLHHSASHSMCNAQTKWVIL